MSMLRNLEAKLGGLVEGAFGRAFKSSVQPVELAHKLAKEMEDNQMVSVSRVYVPNHYRVFLSPADREQFASYEPALRKELSDYLLEHARQEGLALSTPPAGGVPHRRAARPRRVRHPGPAARPPDEEEAARRRRRPVRGRLRAHDGLLARPASRASSSPAHDRAPGAARGRGPAQRAARAAAWWWAAAATATSCWTTPTSRAATPSCAATTSGWTVADLGSTNGIKVNGQRVEQPPLRPGDRITIGVTDLTFELE